MLRVYDNILAISIFYLIFIMYIFYIFQGLQTQDRYLFLFSDLFLVAKQK